MWEIFTFGGGDSLAIVFSAIVALTDTSDFMALVRLLLIATGLFVAIEVAFTARLQPAPRILIFVFLFYVGFVLDTEIQITDRVDPAASTTVSDVPVGIAVPASFISTIGDWATRSFETFFALPNDIKYSENGMLMASRLVESANQWYPADSRFAENLQNFMGDCVQYGILVGWFSWSEMLNSNDIWSDIGAAGLGSGIYTRYTDNTGVTSLIPCNAAYTSIDAEWSTATDDTTSVYAQKFFPKQTSADANTRLQATLPVAWSYLAGVSSSASDLVKQKVVLNVFQRSASSLAAQSGATGAMQDYALAIAQVQQRTTYQTLGALAGRTIILIHNIFEVIVYGIFPLALLMVMISIKQGQNFLMYIKSILWLQLWAPLFALLNFVTSFYGANTTAAAANYIDGGSLSAGLNLLTIMDITSANGDISAMAGYLAWMIPILAWSIVSASGSAGAHLATSLGAVGQSAGSQAASEASRGNISTGQLSLDNQRAGQVMLAPSMAAGHGSHTGSDGITNTLTGGAGGGIVQSVPQHSFGVSTQASSAIKSGIQTKATEEMGQAYRATSASTTAISAALNQTQAHAESTGATAGVSTVGSTGSTTKAGSHSNVISSFSDAMSSNHGFSESDSTAILSAATAAYNAKLPKIPGASILKALGGFNAGVSGAINGKTDAQLNDAWNQAMNVAHSDDFRNTLGLDTASGVNTSGTTGINTNDSTTSGTDAILARAQSANQLAAQEVAEAQRWQKASAHISENGFSASGDITAAVFSSLAGQEKTGGAVDYGSSSPQWTSGDITQLKQQSAMGNPTAVGIFMEAAANFGQQEGLRLAGVEGPSEKPQYETPTMNGGQMVGIHNDNVSKVGGSGMTPEQVTTAANSVVDTASDSLNSANAELGNRGQNLEQRNSDFRQQTNDQLDRTPKGVVVGTLINRINPFKDD